LDRKGRLADAEKVKNVLNELQNAIPVDNSTEYTTEDIPF
jgi:hypothetical protein